RMMSVLAIMQFVALVATPEGHLASTPLSWLHGTLGEPNRASFVGWVAAIVLGFLIVAGMLNILNAYFSQRFARGLEVRLGQALLTHNLERSYVQFTRL